MPHEYLEYMLCRYVYHCLPSQLASEPLDAILNHLAVMNAISTVNGWQAEFDRMSPRSKY